MTQRVTDKELAEMISATGDWVTEIADAVAAARRLLAAVGEGKP